MEGLLSRKDFSLTLFKSFVSESLETLRSFEDAREATAFCEKKIVELTNADSAYILRYDPGERNYYVVTLDKEHTVCQKGDSLFKEVVTKKQPLLLKELEKSLLYQPLCDNLEPKPQKEVALIPLTFQKTVKSMPEILVWCGISQGNNDEFSQKTILYLVKFLEALKPLLLKLEADAQEQQKMTLMQCLESNEMLERQIKRKEQYFHSIIHDIRTPMNALMGFLELLSVNETDETKKEYLESAVKSGEHMVRLINDALDMAKIASGHLAITKKPFEPIREISDIIKIFYETARKKKILLSAYLDPLLPKVVVSDIYRIKQVLSNLLSNAVKFTPQGGSIFVGMTYQHDSDTFTIEVQDSGVGISKEAQEAIFLPFRQEKATTEEEYGGTGLGLSISQQIVVLLGGKLELESEEGKGSRFYFTLPANTPDKTPPSFDVSAVEGKKVVLYRWKERIDVRADVVRRYMRAFGTDIAELDSSTTLESLIQRENDFEAVVIEAESLESDEYEWIQYLLDQGKTVLFFEDIFDEIYKWFMGPLQKIAYPVLPPSLYQALIRRDRVKEPETNIATQFSEKKALVVDDNRINLKFMKEVLKRFGMDTALCEDAECGLEHLENESFDVVFMDENMPKMLGSEAIARIREMEKEGKFSRHVLISLSGDSEHQERILKAGADEVLTKPVQLAVLTETLQKYFGS